MVTRRLCQLRPSRGRDAGAVGTLEVDSDHGFQFLHHKTQMHSDLEADSDGGARAAVGLDGCVANHARVFPSKQGVMPMARSAKRIDEALRA